MAHFIVCRKCGLPGGTLRKVADDKYEHDDCPAPRPSKPRKNRAPSGLILPKSDIAVMRKKLPRDVRT